MTTNADLAAALASSGDMRMRQGTVTAADTGPPPTVDVSINCEGVITGVGIATQQLPVLGDVVWVGQQSGKFVVLGVQQNTDPDPGTDRPVTETDEGVQQGPLITNPDIRYGTIRSTEINTATINNATIDGATITNPTITGARFTDIDLQDVVGEVNGATLINPEIRSPDIDSPAITGDVTIADGYLRSDNYVAGSAGWNIDSAGSAEFNDIIVRDGGMIGGIVLGISDLDGIVHGGHLQSENFSTGSTGWEIDGDGNAEVNNITARGTIETGTAGSNHITMGTTDASYINLYTGDGDELDFGYLRVDVDNTGANDFCYINLVAPSMSVGTRSYLDIRHWDNGDRHTNIYATQTSVIGGPLALDTSLRSANGTAAAPSISFASNGNTGMWRQSLNQIGWSTAGVNRMTLDSTGLTVNTWLSANVTAYPGTSGNDGSYYYAMALDYGGIYGGVLWTRSPIGQVTCEGLVKANSSTIVNGNAFLLAPTWARPSVQRVLTGISNAGGSEAAQRYDFYTNGQLVYKGSSTIANGQFLAVHFTIQDT